ncbi:replication initiation protein, partial [Leptospira borgpetersenii serovar Balcanica]|nr:replication initiation protein [Leptospira borgpetersenii serovar Balcanica]
LAPIYITKDDALSIGFNAKNVARDLRTACSNLRSREIVIPTPFGDKVTGWVYNLLFFKTEIFRKLKERYPDSRHDDEFIEQLRLHNLIDTLPFVMKSDENLMARVIMHPDVVPFLFQLKNNYTQIDLFELAKLTDSVYSLRIFLLMMQWKSSGK